MPTPFKTLVIGIGNPLRGDDGVGCVIVDRLAALNRADLQTMIVHQLLPELSELVQSYSGVVFVDACMDLPGGKWELNPVGINLGDREVSHVINPSWVLGISRSLYGSAPLGWCLRVGGARFEFEQELSAEVAAITDECLHRIVELADVLEADDA